MKFLFWDLVFERLIEAPRGSALSARRCFLVFSASGCTPLSRWLSRSWIYLPSHNCVLRSTRASLPLAAPSSKVGAAPSRPRWPAAPLQSVLGSSVHPGGAQPAVFVPPHAAACRCAAISGRCCRCRGLLRSAHVDLLLRRRSRGRGADGRMGVELCGRRGRADQRVSAGRARQNPGVLALLLAG